MKFVKICLHSDWRLINADLHSIWQMLLTKGFKIFKFTKPQKIGEFSFSFRQIYVDLRSIWRSFLQQNKLSSSRKFVYILQIKIWLTVKRRKALEYSLSAMRTLYDDVPESGFQTHGNEITNNSWNLNIFAEFYSVFWNNNVINVFLLVDFWSTELLSCWVNQLVCASFHRSESKQKLTKTFWFQN